MANVLSLCGIDYDLYQIVVEHHIRERSFLKDAIDDEVMEEPIPKSLI